MCVLMPDGSGGSGGGEEVRVDPGVSRSADGDYRVRIQAKTPAAGGQVTLRGAAMQTPPNTHTFFFISPSKSLSDWAV